MNTAVRLLTTLMPVLEITITAGILTGSQGRGATQRIAVNAGIFVILVPAWTPVVVRITDVYCFRFDLYVCFFSRDNYLVTLGVLFTSSP